MLSGVFTLFASMGFVQLLITGAKVSIISTVAVICIYGVFAIGYALLSILRKFRWLPVWALIHAFAFWAFYASFHLQIIRDRDTLQKQNSVLGFWAIITMVTAYILFVRFMRREGNRYFRIQTEIELAREIHRSLVPTFERSVKGFEVFGASFASGEVGGDLVDIAEYPQGWISYIADISGHGVSSGVLMAMFKTSIRSRLTNGGSPGELLNEVHRTLYPLKMPNMFVTAGVLQFANGNRVNYSLAGHPPLMRYSRAQRAIVEYQAQNLPLGILSEQRFTAETLQCDPGDILLLLTDGFTEVFDGRGAELGLEPIKRAFEEAVDCPLPEIFEKIRKRSLEFGRQEDDQTMLLVRYTG
ncbi:MAG TPA: PP2C family protein-serine/threonine phosphatase [Terriglobales bacterium]|nr:PP2C family protein-serine/threonine phosphatase [Terriglobales bacterium]